MRISAGCPPDAVRALERGQEREIGLRQGRDEALASGRIRADEPRELVERLRTASTIWSSVTLVMGVPKRSRPGFERAG